MHPQFDAKLELVVFFERIMLSVEELMKEALSLPSASRALLAEKLVESLEGGVDESFQKLWTTQAKKRRDEIRSGEVKPISGEEALVEVRGLFDK